MLRIEVCVLQNSYVEALLPNVMVFGDRAFGRCRTGVELSQGISAHIRRVTRELASSFSLSPPCKDIITKQALINS
jgi:hypothetical protein